MSTETNTAPEVKPAISRKLAKATTPPPRKAEIIEAMAIRKHKQLCADAEANRADQEKIRAQLDAVALAHVRKAGQWEPSARISTHYKDDKRQVYEIGVFVKTGEIPREIHRLQDRLNKLREEHRLPPPLNDVKRQIRDAMAGNTAPGERVSAILADPEASRAIDKLLAELERPKVAALTAGKEGVSNV